METARDNAMKPKILLGTSSFGKSNPAPIKLMESHGLEVIPNRYGRKLTRKELLDLLPGITGLLAGLEAVDRGVLKASDLKVVSRCGSGISNVDVEACKELGIVFKYTPFGPTQAVAELTVAMMISLLRDAWAMHANLCKGKWDKRVGFQIKGKTVVIIGFGRIGHRTASLLEPFAVDLIAVDPFLDPKKESLRLMGLHEALPLADIVILHAGGEEEIIAEKELRLMKDGTFFCNAARGQNVNEAALGEALDSGKIAGAWLDSFSCEPYHGPLCGHSRVLMTPHVGSYTTEGRLDMEMEAAQNLINGLAEANQDPAFIKLNTPNARA
jgi:D-3-phosphoglycerate dehydrogenase / 2-oxoglutarate reductase